MRNCRYSGLSAFQQPASCFLHSVTWVHLQHYTTCIIGVFKRQPAYTCDLRAFSMQRSILIAPVWYRKSSSVPLEAKANRLREGLMLWFTEQQLVLAILLLITLRIEASTLYLLKEICSLWLILRIKLFSSALLTLVQVLQRKVGPQYLLLALRKKRFLKSTKLFYKSLTKTLWEISYRGLSICLWK
jgi:hypothetical protein